jgi:SAM-dependent methyltransferase
VLSAAGTRNTAIATLRALIAAADHLPSNTLDQFRSATSAWQYLSVYQLAAEYIPPGAHVLDWGTGNAHFSTFLIRAGYRAVGYSLEACEHDAWRPPPPYEFIQGSRQEPCLLPFPDHTFDAVCSIGVLEHVPETGGSLTDSLHELRRVLRPDGIFLCCHLPNQLSVIEALSRLIPGKYHHAIRFGMDHIHHLFRTAGLRPILLRRYGFLPRNILAHLPVALRQSERLATYYSMVDTLLGRLLPPVCQNWAVVARRDPTSDANPQPS